MGEAEDGRVAGRRERLTPDPSEPPRLERPWPPSGPSGLDGPVAGARIPERFLEHPVLELETWRDVWARDLSFEIRSHRGLSGRLIVLVKRLLRPLARLALADLYERERVYQIGLIDFLRSEREVLVELRDRYYFLRDRTVVDLLQRMDAIFAILDRRSDALEAGLRTVSEEASAREARLEAAAAPRARGEPVAAAAAAPASPRGAEPRPWPHADLFAGQAYLDFVEGERGSEAAIRERQKDYVELFADRAPVVDLGSGRGEFLELLRAASIPAYGVDSNPLVVDATRRRGLDARLGDAARHLEEVPDASLGGIFCSQTYEHWERDTILAVTKLAFRKLRPGGVLVVETQNVAAIAVGASHFWTDITHVTPVHPEALLFVVRAAGFPSADVRYLAPFGEDERLTLAPTAALEGDVKLAVETLNGSLARLNRSLYSFRDYAVVAFK